MTIEQVDRMVRDANPVPDLKALEPVDLSDLHVTQQRSGDMQTQDRIEMDQEPERPNRGLLIGVAAVVVLLIGALVVFLSREEAPVVTPEEYFAEVTRICAASNAKFHAVWATLPEKEVWWEEVVWTLEDQEIWHEAAARFSEEALAELRALSSPDIDTARLEGVFSLMEQQTDVLRQRAAAASAGDAALVETLSGELVDLIHAKDNLGGRDFAYCPLSLPA